MSDEAFYQEFEGWTIGSLDEAFGKGATTVTVARVQSGGIFCGAKASDVGAYYASRDEWARVQGAVHRAVTDGKIRGAWDDINFTSGTPNAIEKAGSNAAYAHYLVVASCPRRAIRTVQHLADKNANVIIAFSGAMAAAQAKAKKQLPSASHKLVFTVALAHGSAMEEVGDFDTTQQLYDSIGAAFDISPSDIVFCTRNTEAVDMEHKLGMQIKPEDTLYVHVRGEQRSLTVKKSDPVLGISLAENGTGLIFVRTITPSGIMDNAGVEVGEHVHSINGTVVDGMTHVKASQMLVDVPVDDDLTIVLTALKKKPSTL